jgi:hypothetical protein
MVTMRFLLLFVSVLPVMAQEPSSSEDLKRLPALSFKEESVGNYQSPGAPVLPTLKITGGFVGIPVKVDAEFTKRFEHAPPSAPFEVVVPKDRDIRVNPGGKQTGAPELVKFTLASADGHAVEILRFTDLNVPQQADPAERLKLCARLLQTQGLAGATKGYDQVAFLEAYATKIGGADAVCVHAHMTSPKTGEHYAVKLVGILHPGNDTGVTAFLMANTNLSKIKNPPDLASKGVGLAIIHSLRFLDVPAEAAAKP